MRTRERYEISSSGRAPRGPPLNLLGISPPQDLEELASLSAGDVAPGQQAYWLRAQFETGALPRDPLFVRNLVEQARRDPRIVSRLVADMAANTGGAPPAVEPGPDGADDPAGRGGAV